MKLTLHNSFDIEELFQRGAKIYTPYFMVLFLKTTDETSGKIAYIAGKKIGNAVKRNKAKRILRALVNVHGNSHMGYKMALVARKNIMNASFSNLSKLYNEKVVSVLN